MEQKKTGRAERVSKLRGTLGLKKTCRNESSPRSHLHTLNALKDSEPPAAHGRREQIRRGRQNSRDSLPGSAVSHPSQMDATDQPRFLDFHSERMDTISCVLLVSDRQAKLTRALVCHPTILVVALPSRALLLGLCSFRGHSVAVVFACFCPRRHSIHLLYRDDRVTVCLACVVRLNHQC